MIRLTDRGQVLADVLDGHEVTISRARMIDLCHDLGAMTPRLAAACEPVIGGFACRLAAGVEFRPAAAQERWRRIPRVARMLAGHGREKSRAA